MKMTFYFNLKDLSCYYSLFSCFLPVILPCAFLSREAFFTTAEPPEPLDSFIVGFSFCKTSLSELVGSAARLFQCIQCILWFEISCSFVPFVVLDE